MQALTWSETPVDGGQKTSVMLPQPTAQMDHYRDALALAFPAVAEAALRRIEAGVDLILLKDENALRGEVFHGIVQAVFPVESAGPQDDAKRLGKVLVSKGLTHSVAPRIDASASG